MRLISVGAGAGGVGLLTRSVRVVELADGVKECKAVSTLVDQMELPNGMVVDHGLRGIDYKTTKNMIFSMVSRTGRDV